MSLVSSIRAIFPLVNISVNHPSIQEVESDVCICSSGLVFHEIVPLSQGELWIFEMWFRNLFIYMRYCAEMGTRSWLCVPAFLAFWEHGHAGMRSHFRSVRPSLLLRTYWPYIFRLLVEFSGLFSCPFCAFQKATILSSVRLLNCIKCFKKLFDPSCLQNLLCLRKLFLSSAGFLASLVFQDAVPEIFKSIWCFPKDSLERKLFRKALDSPRFASGNCSKAVLKLMFLILEFCSGAKTLLTRVFQEPIF